MFLLWPGGGNGGGGVYLPFDEMVGVMGMGMEMGTGARVGTLMRVGSRVGMRAVITRVGRVALIITCRCRVVRVGVGIGGGDGGQY